MALCAARYCHRPTTHTPATRDSHRLARDSPDPAQTHQGYAHSHSTGSRASEATHSTQGTENFKRRMVGWPPRRGESRHPKKKSGRMAYGPWLMAPVSVCRVRGDVRRLSARLPPAEKSPIETTKSSGQTCRVGAGAHVGVGPAAPPHRRGVRRDLNSGEDSGRRAVGARGQRSAAAEASPPRPGEWKDGRANGHLGAFRASERRRTKCTRVVGAGRG